MKVYPNLVKHPSRHTATDYHTGWFAGRMQIDLTGDKFITDVFAYATDHENPATCSVEVDAMSIDWGLPFHKNEEPRIFYGDLRVSFSEWFPTESKETVSVETKPVLLNLRHNQKVVFEVNIPNAKLWSADQPKPI